MALFQALTRTKDELNIEFDISESVSVADAYTVLSGYAEEGYDILLAHSWYPDAIKDIAEQYPDVYILGAGGGTELKVLYPPPEEVPPNVGHYDTWMHETGYLAGMIAGYMTKTNKLGIVAGYPVENANRYMNGFIMGAKDVNAEVRVLLTWIESWFDPAKAKEAAIAQIEAGADIIYSERPGGEVAAEERGLFCIGQDVDNWELAPEATLTSIMWIIDPILRDVVNGVRAGKFENREYAYGLAEGGTDIAPYHGTADVVPEWVKESVAAMKQDIIEGRVVIPHIETKPEEYWGEAL